MKHIVLATLFALHIPICAQETKAPSVNRTNVLASLACFATGVLFFSRAPQQTPAQNFLLGVGIGVCLVKGYQMMSDEIQACKNNQKSQHEENQTQIETVNTVDSDAEKLIEEPELATQ